MNGRTKSLSPFRLGISSNGFAGGPPAVPGHQYQLFHIVIAGIDVQMPITIPTKETITELELIILAMRTRFFH